MLWTATTLALVALSMQHGSVRSPRLDQVAAAQDDPIVARFQLPDGRSRAVVRSDIARDIAARHRRGENGEEALRLLVDRELVAIEAKQAAIEPTQDDIDRYVAAIEAQVENVGSTLEGFLEARRMTRADFERDFVRIQIAHQRLVMRALELDDSSEVTHELLRLWLEEASTRHRVITDEAKLPAGIVAVVGDRRFDMSDLGRVLLPNVPDEERAKYVRRFVLRELLAERAAAAGIEVSEEDTRAEIDARRDRIENDPSYRGISYADWLRTTQGMTVDELARSQQMVATVQQQLLVDLAFPKADLERRLDEDRATVLRDHGEKRAITLVLMRGLEEPNEIVTRTFAEAREELVRVRAKLDEGQSFLRVAQVHSEDPYSKVRGGKVGTFARGASELPDAALQAAFAMKPFDVSEPIRVPQGYCLVRVTKVIPAPDDAVLIDALRDDLAQQFLADMLDAAGIEMVN